MPSVRRSLAFAALVAVLVLSGCSTTSQARTVAVTHGPVTATLVKAGAEGPAIGDQRYFEIVTAVEGSASAGRLDAVLTTTAIDSPDAGSEIRIGTLVFTLGSPADQVVVEGSSIYPSTSSTIKVDSTTVRPIIGGSGAYAGARGWCESTHLADGTWSHVLHLVP